MKHVQITDQLFLWLIQYHLLHKTDAAQEIEQALSAKLNAVVARTHYMEAKHATNQDERDKAWEQYLHLRGINKR